MRPRSREAVSGLVRQIGSSTRMIAPVSMLAIPRSPIAGLAYEFKRVPPLLAVPGIPPARLVGRDIRLRYVGEGVEPAPCGRVGALRPPSGDGVNTLSDQLAGRRSGFPCLGQRHIRKGAESHQVRLAVEFEPVKPRPVARPADLQIVRRRHHKCPAWSGCEPSARSASPIPAPQHTSNAMPNHTPGKHYRSGCPSTGRASGGKCSPDFQIVQRLREVGVARGRQWEGDSPPPCGGGPGWGDHAQASFRAPAQIPSCPPTVIHTNNRACHTPHPRPARSGHSSPSSGA